MISPAAQPQNNPAAMGAATGHSTKYRADIDGLRALAILPVILFHAKLACPGGFVGVDIFFVISGFLISSLIVQEMADGSFSLIHFWERRIRRILPALTLVVLATFIAAAFLFLPGDFAVVGKSTAAQSVLGSNFYFWKQLNGYFAPGSETRPLLHTWSLAVEEQFYVLFPLLLILLARFKKNSLLHGILWLALASFVWSVAGSHMPRNLKSTFYLLPARAWELLLGALLVAGRGKISAGGAARELSGWAGLALIGWPVFFYTSETRFPGLAALPPCLGAALIIYSSEAKLSSVGRMLACKPVIFIGLISYSLYLWHWPLLMFATYLSKYPLGAGAHIALVAASFLLAVLSWQFVEKPFRQRRIFQRRVHIFGFAGVSVVSLLALGLVAASQQGFPARYPVMVMTYAEAQYHSAYIPNTDPESLARAGHLAKFDATPTNPPVDVLIWGDSHAMALTPVIDKLCRQQSLSDMVATHGGVPPVCGAFTVYHSTEKPPEFAMSVFNYITQSPPQKVIIGARWSIYVPSQSFKSNLVATVRSLLKLGVQVYVVKDEPSPGYDVPRFAALAAMRGDDTPLPESTREKYAQANKDLAATFDQIAHLGATVLDPAPYFLDGHGLYGVMKDGKILYYDGDHISPEGSMLLTPLFEPIFHGD